MWSPADAPLASVLARSRGMADAVIKDAAVSSSAMRTLRKIYLIASLASAIVSLIRHQRSDRTRKVRGRASSAQAAAYRSNAAR
jgi:hypothetical protein